MADERWSRADAELAAFVAEDPRFALDADQPAYRGGTNRCTFGSFAGEPVVFKSFLQAERQRHEAACLRHLAATGMVPRIIAEHDGTLIVMNRLAGRDGADPESTPAVRESLSAALGGALGTLASTSLPTAGDGYDPARDFSIILWDRQPARAVERYLAIARRAADAVPSCRNDSSRRSLDRIEAAIPAVAREPSMLFHEDISNFRSQGGRFVGFYDLEMCRVGTPSMQLGVALGQCCHGQLGWEPLLRGFGERMPIPDLAIVAAMGHLYHWIRICRWGWWDGDPAQEHHLREAIADAQWYLDGMAAQDALLGR